MLLVIAADALKRRLEVKPMPPEMRCLTEHNCSTPDPVPVAPLIAPKPSDVKLLDRKPNAHRSIKGR
jgi:hypothetical protein